MIIIMYNIYIYNIIYIYIITIWTEVAVVGHNDDGALL